MYFASTNKQITEMVKAGANPVAAACAVETWDLTGLAICSNIKQ